MKPRDFKFILTLIEDKELESAAYLLRENSPISFILLEKAILEDKNILYKNDYLIMLTDALTGIQAEHLHLLLSKDFEPIERLFIHSNSYLYNQDFSLLFSNYHRFISKLVKDIGKLDVDSMEPAEIIELLHNKLTQRFMIDTLGDDVSSLLNIMENQSISQYSLGILYLIVAEKLELPIFGLPFQDKLILTYTKPYCHHNEQVYENDILYYIIPGERDLIYTPLDMELYAMMYEQTISLENKLPKSNATIMNQWMNHIIHETKDIRRKNALSIKYQQILEVATQFESF